RTNRRSASAMHQEPWTKEFSARCDSSPRKEGMVVMMRIVPLLCFACLCLLLVSATGCGGSSKASMIVGKWEMTEGNGKPLPKEAGSMTTEFTSGGKMSFSAKILGMEKKQDGTYKVDGDKLTVNLDGKEESQTIKSVTSSELILEKGSETMKFKKVS